MRVAICMSGQLREWDYGKENQKWFWTSINRENVEVDYFTHTWSYSQDRPGVSQPYKTRQISDEEYSKFINHYAPKKAVQEDKTKEFFYDEDHWSSLFYSFGQSVLLKQQYELENNFRYDLVIKTRPDIVFNPNFHAHISHVLNDNQIYTTHGGVMPDEYHNINFNDCVFYSNSYTMDLLTNMYAYRQRIIREDQEFRKYRNPGPMGPGVLMHDFFREYGITPYFSTGWQETLLKEGVPKVDLFNPEEFQKVEQYFRNWYYQ